MIKNSQAVGKLRRQISEGIARVYRRPGTFDFRVGARIISQQPREYLLLLIAGIILSFCWGLYVDAQSSAGDAGSVGTQLNFPYTESWAGADAAYSIPFAANQSLWLFGDSFVNVRDPASRSGAKFIRNSIGISNTDSNGKPEWSINYYWGRKGKSDPRAFFEPKEGSGYWYWPMDGFLAGQKLYVVLSRVRALGGSGPFNFEVIGADLASISNFTLPPEKWTVEYVELTSSNVAFPGASTLVIGQYAYFYTLVDKKAEKRRPIVLFRVALKRLTEPNQNLEYYATDHKWKRGFDVLDAAEIFPSGDTEMSVRYHEDSRKWVAVRGPEFLTNKILISTSETITGPWTEWRVLYEVPEMKPSTPGFDQSVFCYAGKEHIEFYQPEKNEILVTYACNSSKPEVLVSNMAIYKPVPVHLALPPDAK